MYVHTYKYTEWLSESGKRKSFPRFNRIVSTNSEANCAFENLFGLCQEAFKRVQFKNVRNFKDKGSEKEKEQEQESCRAASFFSIAIVSHLHEGLKLKCVTGDTYNYQ